MTTEKQLVLVGAGHSNLHLVKNSRLLNKKNFKVTLISPTGLYYNGVAPGVISNYYPKGFGSVSVTCHLTRGKGAFIQQSVEKIDVKEKIVHLSDHRFISFDYLSINIGGYVPTNQILGSSENSFPIRPIDRLWELDAKLQDLIERCPRSISVVVVGGGAAGIELAGNIHQLIQSNGISPNVTVLTRGDTILPQFSASASRKVLSFFKRRGINIKVKSNVIGIRENILELENSDECPFDLCVLAAGILPNKINLNDFIVTTDIGELIINSFLQTKTTPYVFATGDCSYFEEQPLWKSGYHAINQGPVLLKNIIALPKGLPLRKYKPSNRILTALNLGGGMGLLIVGNRSLLGKLSFKIKDFVEKRYINSLKCKEEKKKETPSN